MKNAHRKSLEPEEIVEAEILTDLQQLTLEEEEYNERRSLSLAYQSDTPNVPCVIRTPFQVPNLPDQSANVVIVNYAPVAPNDLDDIRKRILKPNGKLYLLDCPNPPRQSASGYKYVYRNRSGYYVGRYFTNKADAIKAADTLAAIVDSNGRTGVAIENATDKPKNK